MAAFAKLQRFVQSLREPVAFLRIEKDVVGPLRVGVAQACNQQLAPDAEILGLRMNCQPCQLSRSLPIPSSLGMQAESGISNRIFIVERYFHAAFTVKTLQFGHAHVPKQVEGGGIHTGKPRQIGPLRQAQIRCLGHGLNGLRSSIIKSDGIVVYKASLSQTGLEPALIGQSVEKMPSGMCWQRL